MITTAKRRFYRSAGVRPGASGHAVVLDDRPVRTPAGAPLEVPAEPLARLIAEEWESQGEEIRPETMPCTQLAATALDRVRPMRPEIVAAVMRYAETDLLCYRADSPADLVTRQIAAWQPVVDWASRRYDAPLRVTSGILPVPQPPEALAALKAAVEALDDMALSAVQALTAACGSLLLALAVLERRVAPEQAFEASQLDESYQLEQWGEDAEAVERRESLRSDVLAACRFLHCCVDRGDAFSA